MRELVVVRVVAIVDDAWCAARRSAQAEIILTIVICSKAKILSRGVGGHCGNKADCKWSNKGAVHCMSSNQIERQQRRQVACN